MKNREDTKVQQKEEEKKETGRNKLNTKTAKLIYSKIQKLLFYLIPEKWNSIYLYASIKRKINGLETGEMFFYYFPKSILRKNPVNSYEIPNKFHLEEEAYLKLIEKLYSYIKQLYEEFQNTDNAWTNITIKIEKFHFLIEFYQDDINETEEVKHLLWCYQNLKIPIESYQKQDRNIIIQYLEKEKQNPRKKKIYTEPMYRRPIKNVVQYHRNMTEDKKQNQLGQMETLEFYEKDLKINHYKKINDKLLNKVFKQKDKNTRIEKPKQLMEIAEISIEEQIKQQRMFVKTQILSHNVE